MNSLEAFNDTLFLAINATASTPRWLVDIAIAIANDVIYVVPLVLALLWLSGDGFRREAAVRAFCVAMLAQGINQLIGLMWTHPRPFMVGLGHTFLAHAPDSSFPSDHLTMFASIALTLLIAGVRSYGWLMVLAGVVVAWARVFVGVHFPLDMAGGVGVSLLAYAIVAPVWALAGNALMRALVKVYRTLLAWPIGRGWIPA